MKCEEINISRLLLVEKLTAQFVQCTHALCVCAVYQFVRLHDTNYVSSTAQLFHCHENENSSEPLEMTEKKINCNTDVTIHRR